MERIKPKQPLRGVEPDGAGSREPGHAINRVGRYLCDLYALELEFNGHDYLVSPDLARSLLPASSPRTGVLAIEMEDELQLGVYFDPRDRDDPFTLVEEASHLVCLAWHAAHDRPVSPLVLELQSEIDRFFYFCHESGQLSFACFAEGTLAPGLSDDLRVRYDCARERAWRYCRGLVRRFAARGDTRGLARELRRFYRASPSRKLAA